MTDQEFGVGEFVKLDGFSVVGYADICEDMRIQGGLFGHLETIWSLSDFDL